MSLLYRRAYTGSNDCYSLPVLLLRVWDWWIEIALPNAHFRYRCSIEYHDTRDGIVFATIKFEISHNTNNHIRLHLIIVINNFKITVHNCISSTDVYIIMYNQWLLTRWRCFCENNTNCTLRKCCQVIWSLQLINILFSYSSRSKSLTPILSCNIRNTSNCKTTINMLYEVQNYEINSQILTCPVVPRHLSVMHELLCVVMLRSSKLLQVNTVSLVTNRL